MIDFKNIFLNVTEDWLLKNIGDSSIFLLYHGPFKIGNIYQSKFRKDNKPSCGFFIHNTSGRILYKDFAENKHYNCIQFVMQLFSLSYKDALNKIAIDFGLIKGNKNVNINERFYQEAKEIEDNINQEQVLLQFKVKSFDEEDLKYWAQYEIDKEDLEREKIYSVKNLYLNKKEIRNYSKSVRFAYPLLVGEELKVKIYSPYSTIKWLNTIPNDKPFGLNTLPKLSNTLYITKSRKDELVLKKLFTDVISVQNESEQSLSKEVEEFINRTYERKVIVFDADPPGVNACKKFNNRGFEYFNTPNSDYINYKIKDPSDFVRIYGLDILSQLFKNKGYVSNK